MKIVTKIYSEYLEIIAKSKLDLFLLFISSQFVESIKKMANFYLIFISLVYILLIKRHSLYI